MHAKVSRQYVGVCSLLLPCGSQGTNAGHWAWYQTNTLSTKHLTVLLRVVLKQNMRLTHTDCVPHAPDMKLFWSHLASRYFRIRVENQKRKKKKTKQHLTVSQHTRKQGGRQLPPVVLISRMPLALVICYPLVTELSAPFGTRQTSLKCTEPQKRFLTLSWSACQLNRSQSPLKGGNLN